jgi:hypothetical protein
MAWENLFGKKISAVYKFYNVYNISQRGEDLVVESGLEQVRPPVQPPAHRWSRQPEKMKT